MEKALFEEKNFRASRPPKSLKTQDSEPNRTRENPTEPKLKADSSRFKGHLGHHCVQPTQSKAKFLNPAFSFQRHEVANDVFDADDVQYFLNRLLSYHASKLGEIFGFRRLNKMPVR